MRRLLLALALAGIALLTACSPQPAPIPTPTSTRAAQAEVDKVLVFIFENHSLDQVVRAMPSTMALLEEHGYATSFTAITHPSLPNYLAIAGGSTFGVKDDRGPGAYPLPGPSVFGTAIVAGGSAKVYAEAMRRPCQLKNSEGYAVRHNPWTYFADERDLCREFDVPLDALAPDIAAGALPTVGFVVPDLCNSGHDCTLRKTDAWISSWLGVVMAGPDFQSGRLAVVVTEDEDDRSQDNLILTGVLRAGSAPQVVDTPLTLYSLSGLLSEVAGADPLGKAASAPSMADAFRIPLAG